jgi:hypothetical protein
MYLLSTVRPPSVTVRRVRHPLTNRVRTAANKYLAERQLFIFMVAFRKQMRRGLTSRNHIPQSYLILKMEPRIHANDRKF